ncbi:MAG: GlsB/YeaQ/YmgE family stress response membrane protein [Mariniblastus sp.]|nr:GlsB/YeaQ/YmgE family stress response membrane protein [Mariniblastus sp.]
MDYSQLAEYANHGLTWVGFGAVVGLVAKAIMPDRDPGGPIALMVMGMAGALIGCALSRYFFPEQLTEPISLTGLTLGGGSALTVLILYRILGRQLASEARDARRRRHRRRQRLYDAHEE